MTVQDLAKLLNTHLGQGRAQYQITMFHCPDVAHGAEPVTALIEREGTQTLEFYSEPPAGDFSQFVTDTVGIVAAGMGVPTRELTREYRGPTWANCGVCGSPQFYTPSGVTCENGHGGAESTDDDLDELI